MSLKGYLAKRGIILGNDDEVLITANLFKSQSAPVAMTTAATITVAALLGGIIVGTHAAGSAQAYTLPLGTDLDAALTSFMIDNTSFDFSIINLSPADVDDITLTANTGITIVGQPVVHSNEFEASYYCNSSFFRCRKTAANTFVVYRIG